MHRLWRGLVRILFWSFERGTWPYDVMVVAILIFVLATPRHWFNDQPRKHVTANASIQLIAQDASIRLITYRLDAGLLPLSKRAVKPTPELERSTHEILGRSVEELKGRTFQIRSIEPVRGQDGAILYYDIEVKR